MAASINIPPPEDVYRLNGEPHPGRQDWEIGISTIAWDPSRVNDALQGKLEDEESGPMRFGSIVHDHALADASLNEAWVRVKIPETGKWFGGHVDLYDPDTGILRELKTSGKYTADPAKKDDYKTQTSLYAKALRDGEIHTLTCPHCDTTHVETLKHRRSEREVGRWRCAECGEGVFATGQHKAWTPSSEIVAPPRAVVVDFWPYYQKKPERILTLTGKELAREVNMTFAWANRTVQRMLAGSWTPTEHTRAAPEDAQEKLAPSEFEDAMLRTREARAKQKQAKKEYNEGRKTLQQAWPDEEMEEYEAPGCRVKRYPEQKEDVLVVEDTPPLLEEHGKSLEDFTECTLTLEGLRPKHAQALGEMLEGSRVRESVDADAIQTFLEENDADVPTEEVVSKKEQVRFYYEEIEDEGGDS